MKLNKQRRWNLQNILVCKRSKSIKHPSLINNIRNICKRFFDNINANINKQFYENIEDYNRKRDKNIEDIIDWISYRNIL